MADNQKPSNLSWLNLLAVVTLAIGNGIGWYFSSEQPLPPVERWYVTRGGEVIDSPGVVAIANSLEAGEYELAGYPKAGKITRLRVAIGDGSQPIPIPVPPTPPQPPAPIPPSPPAPIPPQPTSLQEKIAVAAVGIPSAEREQIAEIYFRVAGWIEEKKIQSVYLACSTLLGELKAAKYNSPNWESVWKVLRDNPVDNLEDARLLYVRVAAGLRGAK